MSIPTARPHFGQITVLIAVAFSFSVSSVPAALAGTGDPALNLRQPLSPAPLPAPALGATAQAPSPRALAATLSQLTDGLAPSQVQAKDACPPAEPGTGSCAAQALVRRSTRALIHPRVAARSTFTQVFPSRRHGIVPSAASPGTSAGASPPGAGTPAWLQQAYDLGYLSQTGGSGDTVAIVDAFDDAGAESDLGVYRSTYGLPACTTANGCFRKINENGASSPLPSANSGWEGEISLDLDAVSAICPNCHIVLVEASAASGYDLETAVSTAAAWPGVKQISNSWASYSSGQIGGTFTFPGIAVVAASGDWGVASGGYQFYPAAYPGVNAAGGTSLSATSAQSGRGFSEGAWAWNGNDGDSSGCNTQTGISKPPYQTDTGCTGRSYADVSADADPATGIYVYDSGNGGWLVYGGTSLASPLISAYLAVTGINGSSPGWAYADSALLNDPASGSDGSCSISYICNAGPGYDGPTGAGSISGAVVSGAPGIGGPAASTGSYTQSVTSTSATLQGGIYPNGLDTSYYWQYGTTSSYGQQSTAVDVGQGHAPVLATSTLQGLAPSTTYHYRMVAQNSLATTYGYDYTLTTQVATVPPPVNTSPPTIAGIARQGLTLSSGQGSWNPAGTSYAYQWQRSADNGTTWANIGGATGSSYTLTVADETALVRVAVTASNAGGQASANSTAVGPVLSNPPVAMGAPTVTGTAQRTYTLSSTQGSFSGPGIAYTYQWQRSVDGGSTWTPITGATSTAYLLGVGDEGTNIRMLVTATNADGAISQASNATVIISPYPPANTAPPTVSGIAQRTYTLNATLGTWTGPGNSYSYQWQEDFGDGYADIAGATGPTYTLSAADEGATVRVVVNAANADATIVEASQPTTTVLSALPINTVPPTVTGTVQRTGTLTATQGSWAGLGSTYSDQWQSSTDGFTWTNIAGATALTYTLGVADEGTYLRMLVTASNSDGTGTAVSAATINVPSSPPVNTAVPSLSGSAQRGATLTTSQGTWNGIGNAYAYQWQRDTGLGFTNIAGATAASYALMQADEGASMRVIVSATNADGTASAASASSDTVLAAPPINTAIPTVSGTAQRASTLTATQGMWAGVGNAYAYQWQRSGDGGSSWTAIAGASSGSYTLGVADENAKVRVLVTASNPDGTLAVPSGATATVPSAPPVNTAIPTVSGTARRASTLTATQGTWAGVGNAYAYQWQRSGDGGSSWTAIAGASSGSYTLGVADENAKVRVLVTASNPDGTLAVPSGATATVPSAPPVNTTVPAISGTVQRTGSLTATHGTWNGIGNTYAYQWQRSGDGGSSWTAIAGASSGSYTLGVADEYMKVRVLVTASNPDGTLAVPSAASNTVPSAPPVNTTIPTVSGTARRASTLTATQGTWNGIGNAYSYQWQHDQGAGFVAITGATSSTYTLGVADENTTVRVLVMATNADGVISVPSAATATIPSAPPVNTAVPTISGQAQRASTLVASQGTWNGIGNIYAYEWQRSGAGGTWTAITGASSSSYTLGVGDEGAKVRVLVTATNPDASAATPSAATATVQNGPPLWTAAPTISGTAQRASTLTATQGTWSGIGNTYAYQWQRSTDNATWITIAGATATTYTLGTADENTLVRVLVTASNTDGSLSVASDPSSWVASAPPVTTASPTVSGTAQRTFTLTATQGTWSGIGNAYVVQWQRSADGATWTNITGATGSTYTLGVADENLKLRVIVSASNPDGTATATSVATPTIQSAPPVISALPTVSGTAQRTDTLTVTNGTWSGPDNAYAYQWQRSTTGGASWTNIAGATSTTYLLAAADEHASVRAFVTATNPDGAAAVGSPTTSPVAPAPPVNTSKPAITGAARVGATLGAGSGDWSPAGATFSYDWQRCSSSGSSCQDIAGAGTSSYTLQDADALQTVRVIVTATNVDGPGSATSATTATIAQPPQNTKAPAPPSGTLMDTYLLTADSGSWDTPSATFSYSWLRCPSGATSAGSGCTAIGSGPTYTLTAADVGHPIAVIVTASSAGGSSEPVTSAPSQPVAGRPLTNTVPPSISGNPQVPQTLSANPGTWTPSTATVTVAWDRCDANGTSNCTQVAGNVTQYTLSGADRDHTIVLESDASSPGRTASARSQAVSIEDQPLPQDTVAPTLSGGAVRGGRLQGTPGTWTNSPTLTYQWQRCDASGASCQPIAGATNLDYVLAQADEGATITLQVSAANTSGTTQASATPSAVVAPLLPRSTSAPVIKGAAVQQAVQLGITGSTWQVSDPTTYADAWERCDATGNACQTIAGATGTLYTPVGADVGHTLVAVVTATNIDGSVHVSSAATAVVQPAAPRWRALPVVATDGTGQIGDTISITAGTWSGPAVSGDTVQMMRCTSTCSPVGSAGASSYTIASADLGAILRVRETASNAGGSTVVWSAFYIGPVSSAASGSAVLGSNPVPLRNADGATLAVASFGAPAVQAAIARVGAAPQRTVSVRRAPGITGALKAWACPVSSQRGGPPASCSRAVSLRTSATLRLPSGTSGKVRVVVVRRSR